jgi:predicted ABC-type ATPase
VQEGEPDEDGEDESDDIGLASVAPYKRTSRRGRVESVRGYHSRNERALLNGWIPQAKWKEGQDNWAIKGEAIWRANEWKPKAAADLKPGDQVQVTHPTAGTPVTGTVRAVNRDGDDVRVDVEHPQEVPRPYELPNVPVEKLRPEITPDEARGNSRPVSAHEFQQLAQAGSKMVADMKRDSSQITGLEDHWDDLKDRSYKAAQQSWGGMTIDSHTGTPVESNADRYAMSVKPASFHSVSVPENATREEFGNAMDRAREAFRPVLERKGYHLGVFHDDENHRIDIDPVAVVDTPYQVEAIGAYAHSIGGAYHFKSGDGYFPPHVSAGAETQPLERSVVTLPATRQVPSQPPAPEESPLADIKAKIHHEKQDHDPPVPAGQIKIVLDQLQKDLPAEGDNSAWRWDLAADGGPNAETMRRNAVIHQAGQLLDGELQRRVNAAVAKAGDKSAEIDKLQTQMQGIEDSRWAAYTEMQQARRVVLDREAAKAGFDSMAKLQDRLDNLSKSLDAGQIPVGMTREQLRSEIPKLATIVSAAGYKAGQATVAQATQMNEILHQKKLVQVPLLRLTHLRQTVEHDEAVKLLQEARGDQLGGPGLKYHAPGGGAPSADAVKAMQWAEANYPQPWLEYARQHSPSGYSLETGVPRGDYTDSTKAIRLSDEGPQQVAGAGKSGRVAMHELGHIMEQAVPGVVPLEQAEIWRRTSHGKVGARRIEPPESMDGYTREYARPDHFPSPYSGKDYADGGDKVADAYELFTTGAESVFAGSDYADDEFRHWMLGTMALLGRQPQTTEAIAGRNQVMASQLRQFASAAAKREAGMLSDAAASLDRGDTKQAEFLIRQAASGKDKAAPSYLAVAEQLASVNVPPVARSGKTLDEPGPASSLPWTPDAENNHVAFHDSLGIDRSQMPQLSGTVNGQYRGSAEVTAQFDRWLMDKGIKTEAVQVPLSSLKPTQDNGSAKAIRAIADNLESGKLKATKAIYISADNRIFDGHHTWAAKTLAFSENGKDPNILAERADIPMTELLKLGTQFDEEVGIPKQTVDQGSLKDVAKDAAPAPEPADTMAKYMVNGKWTPERAALHEQIIAKALAGHKPQRHPAATFYGGGPASGKSALTPASGENSAVHIDSDEIKTMLPEYQQMLKAKDPRAAAYVHEESSAVSKEVMRRAQQQRLNFVLDGTGDSSYTKMAGKVRQAKEAGYSTHGRYVTADADTAVERAMKRAKRTGRMVPESVIRSVHSSVSQVFPELVRNHDFDSVELYDNNGKKPKKILEWPAGGQLNVIDHQAWQRFLDKAPSVPNTQPYTGNTEDQARAAEIGKLPPAELNKVLDKRNRELWEQLNEEEYARSVGSGPGVVPADYLEVQNSGPGSQAADVPAPR